jgi:hypothetical protein
MFDVLGDLSNYRALSRGLVQVHVRFHYYDRQ